ncbi:MAG: VOC family protein, partial [Chloroflexota bacterium]
LCIDCVKMMMVSMHKLASFYRQGLGYEGEMNERPGHIGFPLENGVYLGFDQMDQPYQDGGVSLWFAVKSLDDTFQRFVAAGAKVRYETKELPMGDVLAALYDLDGNILGLVER